MSERKWHSFGNNRVLGPGCYHVQGHRTQSRFSSFQTQEFRQPPSISRVCKLCLKRGRLRHGSLPETPILGLKPGPSPGSYMKGVLERGIHRGQCHTLFFYMQFSVIYFFPFSQLEKTWQRNELVANVSTHVALSNIGLCAFVLDSVITIQSK